MMARFTIAGIVAMSAIGHINGRTAPNAGSLSTWNSDAAVLIDEPVRPVSTVDPRAYVQDRASRHGWSLSQWRCAARLVQRESSWRVDAKNPNSSAYGLFQILRMPHGTPLRKQVDRFIRYIDARYNDDPCAALRHSLQEGWY